MSQNLKYISIFVSMVGLGLTIIPAILVFGVSISMPFNKQLMFIGMILWFLTAPYWIKEQEV